MPLVMQAGQGEAVPNLGNDVVARRLQSEVGAGTPQVANAQQGTTPVAQPKGTSDPIGDFFNRSPLLRTDPDVGLAPIQLIGLATAKGGTPMQGLQAFLKMKQMAQGQQNQQQNQLYDQRMDAVRLGMDQEKQGYMSDYYKAQTERARRPAQVRAQTVKPMSFSEATKRAEWEWKKQGCKDELGLPTGKEGCTAADEAAFMQKRVKALRRESMSGVGTPATSTTSTPTAQPWDSFSDDQKAKYLESKPEIVEKYYPEVWKSYQETLDTEE